MIIIIIIIIIIITIITLAIRLNKYSKDAAQQGRTETIYSCRWQLRYSPCMTLEHSQQPAQIGCVSLFSEGEKTGISGEEPSEQGQRPTQTQPTYDAGCRNRTRATLVGSECSHHYTIPAPRSVSKMSTTSSSTI